MVEPRCRPNRAVKGYTKQRGGWKPFSDFATITALVTITGQPAHVFMLTAGHAFRDKDSFSEKKLTGAYAGRDQQLNISIPAPSITDDGQEPVFWGEDRIGSDIPYAESYGVYHCACDKLDSKVDAGLAQLRTDLPRGAWSNVFSGDLTYTLTGFDPWPPRLADDEEYRLGGVLITTQMIQRDTFRVTGQAKSYTQTGSLERVLITSGSHSTTPGVSGAPLVRIKRNDQTKAVLVGMLVGRSKDLANPDDTRVYEYYQHISKIKDVLHLEGLAVPH